MWVNNFIQNFRVVGLKKPPKFISMKWATKRGNCRKSMYKIELPVHMNFFI